MKILPALALLLSTGLGWGQPTPLKGIAHVGYRVRDLEQTGTYYTSVLGFPRAFTAANGAVFYRINDAQHLEFAAGPGPQDNVRLTHIALETSDIQGLRRLLRS